MLNNRLKTILTKCLAKISLFLVTLSVFLSHFISLAQEDFDADNISFFMLKPILVTIFNIFIIVVGGVFVIMVAYGIWKSSLALGDPRGLEGAKQTWTYALYGFVVVVFFFALFLIISRIFGITSLGNTGTFLEQVFNAINDLVSLPNKSIPSQYQSP